MAVDRKRIEDIKRRSEERERKAKRRIFMLRRVLLALAALAIIAAAVFAVRGCVGSIRKKHAENAALKAAESTAVPTPAPSPSYNEKGINETFFSNSAFFGNSFIEGMKVYELVPSDTDYISKVGFTVSQASTEAADGGTVPAIEEFSSGRQYDKIFMMFGENEIGWIGDAFFEQYEAMINKIKEMQPDAKIYLMSITPISKTASDRADDGLTLSKIKAYNSGIKTVAANTNSTYVDLFTVIAGPDGYLPENAATDGVHFGEDYYIKCLKYMQEQI